MAHILVTGGAGYIGSTTCKLLAEQGHEVTVYDNLSTGHAEFAAFGNLVVGDIRDTQKLQQTMASASIDGIIHFAASAYIGESVLKPDLYYDNNVGGTLSLLKAMVASNVKDIVVSSTCAVYGQPDVLPITENTALNPINPYGATKAMMEQMCHDFGTAYGIRTVVLRYFNACGTEAGYQVGERHDPEPHIIPRIFMAADGELQKFQVFGSDYPTPDGTCIRDYIHVEDLARAHISAFDYLKDRKTSLTCNVGTGRGYSVNEIVAAAKRVTNRDIAVEYKERRTGDPAALVSDPGLAETALGWTAQYLDIEDMIRSAYFWHQKERQRDAAFGAMTL